MARDFGDILKEIGWIDGLQLPVANDENKKLQNELEEMLHRKAVLMVQLDSANENVISLKNHIKDVKNEMDINQQISVAHNCQLDTEHSLLKDSEFQLSKTQQEIRTMDKDINHIEETNQMYQTEIEHATKKLNLLKDTLQWGEEARLAWEEDLAHGERDYNMLAKYKLEDDSKFKEMELKRQRLKADVKERDAILSKEINEISNMENQLEQISTLFRQVHTERASLLHHWDEAVTILKQRDANIHSVLLDIEKLRKEAREMYSTLNENRKFYKTQISNNEEVKKQVDEANFKAIHQRQANTHLVHMTDEIRSELTSLRNMLSDLGTSLNTQRSNNKHITTEVKKKTEHYQNVVQEVDALRQKLEYLNNEAMTATQHAREIEKILLSTEYNKSVMMNKLGKLQTQVFEKKQELERLKTTSSLQEQELLTCVSNKKAFFKRAADIDNSIMRKEQVLYELEMQLVQMEGKLARLSGERTGEEKDQLRQKICELEVEQKKTQEIYNLLNSQYESAKKEHARLRNILEEDAVTLRKLTENRQERIYLVEGANKELTALQQKNKQLQVQHNMLKLRVEQVQKALAKEDTSVISLERQKLELETAMKERKIEITAQKEILLAKKRRLLEDKSELIRAIEHVNIRISQLQKRYDIIMDSLGSKDSGEEFSISRFKIQMAQEKYELQEKGDELDAKIKKSEKEILAMENTLRVINASNECYKRNLDSINANSPEVQEKKDLEAQYEILWKTLKQKQTDLKNVMDNIQEMEETLAELGDAEERVQADWRERDISARQLDKDLVEQQRKLLRAEKLLNRLVKDVRKMKESRIPTHLAEKDIELRGLQELNQSGLQQLAELAARYMETGPVLNRYLAEKNLALPMVRCTGSNTARTKLSCSTLSINQSAPSDDGKSSHFTWSSSPQSQAPSVITLDPSSILSDKSKKSVPKKTSNNSKLGKQTKQ